SLANLGRMAELRARVHAHLKDAREHGDLHATTNLRIGHPNLVWLMDDDASGARREISAAMAEWSLPGFQVEQFYELLAWTNVELYAGQPARARSLQLEAWPKLGGSQLLRISAARVSMNGARARAALALAESEPGMSAAMLEEAEHFAKRVARER